MDHFEIDLWAVGIAAAVNFLIGLVWYSHWLFGDFFAPSSKRSHSGLELLWGFLTACVTAYILGLLESLLGVTTVSDGMYIGFLAWLGFVATTQIGQVIWKRVPFQRFLIATGCKLLAYLSMGGILGA